MRIGIDGSRLSEDQATGVERYATLLVPPLVRALRRGGHRVTVYTRASQSLSLEGANLRRIPVWRSWTHAGLGPAAILDRVDRLFVPSHVLPFLRPRRCIVVLHDCCFEETPGVYPLWQRWYLRVATADALRSSRVLTHSQASYRALIHTFRADPHRVSIIPPAAMPVGMAENSVPWPKPYLLYVGRIEARKNISTLLRAFDRLLTRRGHLPHRLVLLGHDGYGADRIRALHKTLAHNNRILFQGYAGDALRDTAIRSASGLVLPSVCEGSSLVLLEARTARLAFASSGHAACREAGGREGIYVETPEDPDLWAAALGELLDAPRAPLLPPERTWEHVAQEIAELITAPDAAFTARASVTAYVPARS